MAIMNKPAGYDEAQANTGDFLNIVPGGYICKIVKAINTQSKSGKDMLILNLDIAEGEYADFYRKQYDNNGTSNHEPKWGCTFYQLTEGKSTPFFKGLISNIETSNNFNWNFEINDLKGKKIGFIFANEEYENKQGEHKMFCKPLAHKSVDKIIAGDFIVPKDKYLSNKPSLNNSSSNSNDFSEIDDDGDLPF